jgi:hypothetical protein
MALSENATLAGARDLFDKNPQYLDILVTKDGTKNRIVVGWITNVGATGSHDLISPL